MVALEVHRQSTPDLCLPLLEVPYFHGALSFSLYLENSVFRIPRGGGGISVDVIWEEKYEKARKKGGKIKKKKEERGKKMRKG